MLGSRVQEFKALFRLQSRFFFLKAYVSPQLPASYPQRTTSSQKIAL